VLEHVIGERSLIDDGIPPVVHPDALREQLATHAVSLALDRIDAQSNPHHQPASVAGTGSSGG
jgi:hypothetical protein